MSIDSEHSEKETGSFSILKANLAKNPEMMEIIKSNSFAINKGMSGMFELNQDLKKNLALAAAATPFKPMFETTALQMMVDANKKANAFYKTDLSGIAMAMTKAQTDFRAIMKATGIGESLKTFETFAKHNAAIESIQKSLITSNAMSELFKDALHFSTLSEKSMGSFAWDKLGNELALQQKAKNQLSSVFAGLNNSYFKLYNSFEKNPLEFTNINPSITKLIPTEYYTGSNLLKVISVKKDTAKTDNNELEEIRQENESALELYLPKVKAGLLRMWYGAEQALASTNVDKERHFIVSLRELFTHLMHELAPDNEIKQWSQNPTHFHNGRPIRKARFEYIYRNIDSQEFGTFFKMDIDATLAFIDIFNKSTHNTDNNLSDQQLYAIKVKAETTLNFILKVHFNSQL